MKKKAYMICDWADQKATQQDEPLHIGIEYMGNCTGRIVDEENNTLGEHFSSNYGWLRSDLREKVNDDEYEIVDLIGQEIPPHLKLKDTPVIEAQEEESSETR